MACNLTYVSILNSMVMRFIPTRFHGMLDYIVGILLIIAPWIFGFADGGAEMWVLIVAGLVALVQTVFTDFELGLVHKVSVTTHLRVDLLFGVFLIVSPWLFNFDEVVWEPHVAFGIFSIMASLTTRKTPSYQQQLGKLHV